MAPALCGVRWGGDGAATRHSRSPQGQTPRLPGWARASLHSRPSWPVWEPGESKAFSPSSLSSSRTRFPHKDNIAQRLAVTPPRTPKMDEVSRPKHTLVHKRGFVLCIQCHPSAEAAPGSRSIQGDAASLRDPDLFLFPITKAGSLPQWFFLTSSP